MFQIEQCRLLAALVYKSCGDTRLAAAAGTSDAMDIILDLTWHIKVDDVLDVSKVQSLRGNIRRDEHILLPRLVQGNRLVTFFLILPPVDAHRLYSLEQQVLVNIVHVALLLAKYDHGGRCLLQALQQVHDFGLLFNVLHFLNDVEVGGASSAHIHDDGPHERLLRKVLKLLGKCRRVQDGLTLVMEVVHDLSHLLVESQVEHAIGLVQTNVPAYVQVDGTLLQKIAQPTGRGHDAVHPLLPKRLQLLPCRLPPYQ
mmetsp:Transcript_3112/g.7902  ORF Transcript_3112/g.7902 Transcript_3112/m.7902 type:complete len:256 (-) Transcript_3112:330-1097(-)